MAGSTDELMRPDNVAGIDVIATSDILLQYRSQGADPKPDQFQNLPHSLWTELCLLSSNSYVTVLTPSMTVFGDRTLRELISVTRHHEGRETRDLSVSSCMQRKAV